MKKIAFVLFFCFCTGVVQAQIEAARKDTSPIVVINFLRYKRVFTWVTVGPSINSNKLNKIDGNLGLDIHFHRKKNLYFLGLMRGKEFVGGFFPKFYDQVFNELHAGLGFERDRIRNIAGIFVGPSYMLGHYTRKDGVPMVGISNLGVFATAKIVRRPYYDVGYGLELFGVYNKEYPIAGIRAILFFSDAYKGKQNYNTR